MKRIIGSFLLAAGCLIASASASAGGLCTHPLPPECINPVWGVIDPDGLTASSENSGSASTIASGGTVRLMPVAMEAQSSRGPKRAIGPLLFVDDGLRFPRETRALIASIQRATFDRKGNLVAGGERIAEAVEAVRRVASDHVLSLYVRRPRVIGDTDAAVLARKLDAINEIFKRRDDYKSNANK